MRMHQKRSYKRTIHTLFYKIRIHPWYQQMMLWPFWVRLILSISLFLVGLVALVTPIPAGWVMLLTSAILIFGIRMVRRHSIRLFFTLRLHRAAEWIRYRKWW